MGADLAAEFPDGLVTCDMVAQMSYCPRRFHLMYNEGRWSDNHYTIDGKHVHRRVDRIDQVLPEAEEGTKAQVAGDEPPVIVRSVPLSSETLGLTGKLDLVSCDPEGGEAMPVETKRGRVPENEERSWEPERVQVMAQALLLREHGYKVEKGVLYYAGSRTRVEVPLTPALEARTRELLEQARAAEGCTVMPDPLEDSPKCWGCSLNGICLPDETLALKALGRAPRSADLQVGVQEEAQSAGLKTSVPGAAVNSGALGEIRRLYPAREDAVPLYVQEQGARVGKRGETIQVEKGKAFLGEAKLKNTSQLVLMGNVQVSAQCLHLLCEAGVPIVHLSMGGWFYGITQGWGLRNAFDRAAQFDLAKDPARCLALAKEVVRAKGVNQRALLMRNAERSERADPGGYGDFAFPGSEEAETSVPSNEKGYDACVRDMARLLDRVEAAPSAEELLGLEGSIAAQYFGRFHTMLKPKDFDACWDARGRNRRPPRDPVNAMLSFAYAILAKECAVALQAEGLDPWWGFYHKPRHGKPSLALDLMEPFRPTVADSAVLTAINTGMVSSKDFVTGAGACVMAPAARKALLRAYEGRLEQMVTHPVFDYRVSWRTVIKTQARLLSRFLRGDIARWECLTVR